MIKETLTAAFMASLAGPAFALNIVVSNDDGLTSNLKALYEALTAAGHDVIVSAPCLGQSGMGGAIHFLKPIGTLTENCLNDAAVSGEPGAGPMTKTGFNNGDYHYVNSTPVTAMLYGIDVIAQARWGALPDLVLSGPNEGQNVGDIVMSSGTVNNVQNAGSLGLPAIALSAGTNTKDNPGLANPLSATVANLAVEFITALQTQAGEDRLMPAGMVLNVNFPSELNDAEWKFSRIGTYNTYRIKFVDDLSTDRLAAARGLAEVHAPGISIGRNKATATPDQAEDEAVVYKTAIAVTAMQIAFDQPEAGQTWLKDRLHGLSGH